MANPMPKCPDTDRFQRKAVILDDFRSNNPACDRIRLRAQEVALSGRRCLLRGPSGSGKTYLAQAIHLASDRAEGPFIQALLACVPENLAYSEVFGHVKGSFTHAQEESPGLVGQAEGGTLFIDEVAEIPLVVQPMLLRLIDQREYAPLGGKARPADVHILLATNRDLAAMVRAGQFRADLWYRIREVILDLPPLSARREDVKDLLFAFLTDFGREDLAKREAFEDAAWEYVQTNDFPGNLRDLRTMARRAAIFVRDRRVRREDILIETEVDPQAPAAAKPVWQPESLVPLEEMNRRYVCHAVKLLGGNLSRAAKTLGVCRNFLKRIWNARAGD